MKLAKAKKREKLEKNEFFFFKGRWTCSFDTIKEYRIQSLCWVEKPHPVSRILFCINTKERCYVYNIFTTN